MTPTSWTPVPPHPPTPEAILDEELAIRWEAATDEVVAGILQQVQAGITPEVVKDLALRLFPDGLPGQRWPTAYGGVLNTLRQNGV